MRANQDELDLQNTADIIRKEFFEAKKNQIGKPYRPNDRHDKNEYWLKAAEKCLEHHATPADWVAAAFRYNTINGGPFPHTIYGKAAVKWYDSYRREFLLNTDIDETPTEQYVKFAFDKALHLLYSRSGSTNIQDNIEDLKKRYLDIEPWIRVLLAPFDEEIVDMFGEEAWLELQANKHIYSALKNLGHDLTVLDKFRK